MKISEFKNEDALELIMDLLDPIGALFEDQEFVGSIRSGNKMKAVKIAIKNHKSDIILMLARLNNQNVEEYEGNIITMTKQILDVLNDKELSDFFISQGLIEGEDLSSDPMESIQGKKK